MTRLLKTPIIGPSTAIVDSSWIDMLAGLVISGIRNVPPGFWASAGETAAAQLSAMNPAAQRRQRKSIVHLPEFAAPGPLVIAMPVYLSSHTSSMRQPLNRLLTISVKPFTRGCQQVPPRV